MTQEDKELLLRDLCGRLPYGVVIQEKCIEHDKTFLPYPGDNKLVNIDVHEDLVITNSGSRYYIEEFKPYLLPLYSMTREQREEIEDKLIFPNKSDGGWIEILYNNKYEIPFWFVDFCNKNHLDYRGLIEKSLALDATNLGIYE